MKAKVVSFHTPDPRYTKFAERLAESCKKHHQPFVITPMRQHFDTWVEMVSLKAAVMLKTMQILAEPLVWVDADAELKAPLDMLNFTDADFAIYRKDRKKRTWKPIGRPKSVTLPECCGTHWFLTGTVFVNNTKGGLNFLREWKRRAEENRRGYQQLICQEAWAAVQPNTMWLPETYCSIYGRAKPAVIAHDLASCKRGKGVPAVVRA